MRSQAVRTVWSAVGNIGGDMGAAFCDSTEIVISGGGACLPLTSGVFATSIASLKVYTGQTLAYGVTAQSDGWFYDCNGSDAATGGQSYAFVICLKKE